MKRIAFACAILGAAAQTSIAETAWQKLDDGMNVIRECASDVRQYCADTKLGDGRIKACMASHLSQLSTDCLKSLAQPVPEVLSDGANAQTMRIENSHLMRFIEMYLAGIDPATGNIVAECYGTYANPDVPADKDTAPQDLVSTLDMKLIKQQYGVLAASLNGPKLWIPDWFEVEVGKVRQFGGISAPWTAQVNLGRDVDVNNVKAYVPTTIARKSAIQWNKGTTVMVLDDPQGNTWIMKGFQLGLTPKLTYDQFMAAGAANFKQLPSGWKARVVTLQQDNHEVPENGVATILPDEFFNIYDKTGPGMSSFKP
jgi:hypothetical protein